MPVDRTMAGVAMGSVRVDAVASATGSTTRMTATDPLLVVWAGMSVFYNVYLNLESVVSALWVLVCVLCQDQNYCHVLQSNLAPSNRSDPTPISTIPTWHSAFSYYSHHLYADCIHRDRVRQQLPL